MSFQQVPLYAGRERIRGIASILTGTIVVAALVLVLLSQTPYTPIYSLQRPATASCSDSIASRLPWSAAYTRNATRAINDWQDTLLQRTIKIYNDYNSDPQNEFAKYPRTSPRPLHEPANWTRYNLYDAYVQCPLGSLEKFGGAYWNGVLDGYKWLCSDLIKTAPCLVYSVGSHEEFSFEEAILRDTPCEVHTFDCTSKPKEISNRHKYHSICIGKPKNKAQEGKFLTLSEIKAMLGHDKIDVLKMDIEGFEYDLFNDWNTDVADDLPLQVSVELHYNHIYLWTPFDGKHDYSNLVYPRRQIGTAELALMVSHLTRLGYAIVSREDNTLCPHCSELTLIKIR